jgi:hypothetical protein
LNESQRLSILKLLYDFFKMAHMAWCKHNLIKIKKTYDVPVHSKSSVKFK